MDKPQESTLEVSFPKMLTFSFVSMSLFVIGLFVIGLPMHDPLLIDFGVALVLAMTVIFAVGFCFMLRCRIDHNGLRSATWGYKRVLPWSDITSVRNRWPFYIVRGRKIEEFCILPYRFMLRRPEQLQQLIEQYAPTENILRVKLAN